MKASALLLFILAAITGHAQNTNANINSYKYVIVPEKFDIMKYEDQYGLNTTTKHLLEAKGFVVFVSTESLPPALAANKCLALKADVTQRNGLFATRLTLLLKDCYGNVVFKGKEGKSTEKDFPVAYDGALRDAFVSLNTAAYKYDSTIATAQPQQTTPQQQVAQPQQTAQPQQVAVTPAVASPAPATTTPTGTTPPAPVSTTPAAGGLAGTLYAQPTPNGYKLVDTTPKKILTLLKTSVQDYFIADAGGNSGIVFKRNGEWFFERYEDNKLVSQKLDIKF
jgi:hypothetical protein